MSLIIQDDAGLIADVNSYVTVAYCDAYLATVGKDTDWSTKSDAEKEIALINAFNYLDNAYIYKGTSITHESNFPRASLVVDGLVLIGVPKAIKKAQCELALIYILQGVLDTNIDYTNSDTKTIIEESKDIAGAIKKSFKYASDGESKKEYRYYHTVDKYLNGFVSSLGNADCNAGETASYGSFDILRDL